MALFFAAFAAVLHLSQAAVALLDSKCVNSTSASREAESSTLSLLQTGLQVRRLQAASRQAEDTQTKWETHFDAAFHLYGLNRNATTRRPDRMFELSTKADGKCYMKVPKFVNDPFAKSKGKAVDGANLDEPVIFDEEPEYSGFIHGECPQVLPVLMKKRLQLLRPSMNPGLAPMPAKLNASFPTGRWLTISMSQAHIFDEHFNLLSFKLNQVRAAGVPPEIYFSKSVNTWLPADASLLIDARLFAMDDGNIAVSFMPYELQFTSHALSYPRSWWVEQTFGILHVDAHGSLLGPLLDAWIERKETRNLVQCPGQIKNNDWDNATKKNMNFMQRPGGDLFLVDWVHPPSVGKLDMKSPPQQVNGSLFGGTCFGYSKGKKLSDESVFGINPPGTTAEKKNQTRIAYHSKPNGNGAPMIWIDEIQEFLGVAHLHRGWSDSVSNVKRGKRASTFGHHYTHLFYTLSKEPPFNLTSMSPEWCLPSDHDPQDCEVVQFVSGFVRDGQQVVMTYGVMDLDGYAATVNVGTILSLLRPVA